MIKLSELIENEFLEEKYKVHRFVKKLITDKKAKRFIDAYNLQKRRIRLIRDDINHLKREGASIYRIDNLYKDLNRNIKELNELKKEIKNIHHSRKMENFKSDKELVKNIGYNLVGSSAIIGGALAYRKHKEKKND